MRGRVCSFQMVEGQQDSHEAFGRSPGSQCLTPRDLGPKQQARACPGGKRCGRGNSARLGRLRGIIDSALDLPFTGMPNFSADTGFAG